MKDPKFFDKQSLCHLSLCRWCNIEESVKSSEEVAPFGSSFLSDNGRVCLLVPVAVWAALSVAFSMLDTCLAVANSCCLKSKKQCQIPYTLVYLWWMEVLKRSLWLQVSLSFLKDLWWLYCWTIRWRTCRSASNWTPRSRSGSRGSSKPPRCRWPHACGSSEQSGFRLAQWLQHSYWSLLAV